MKKIVFLDIDGVLNKHDTKDKISWHTGIDPELVPKLKRIIEATDAKIVLSSTWRRQYGLADMRGFLAERGFEKAPFFDKTPVTGHRGTEIAKWLESCKFEGTFVALDDDRAVGDSHVPERVRANWIQTLEHEGLTDEHVERAIKILGPVTETAE